jgi:receptor protein-tyrosine kinase
MSANAVFEQARGLEGVSIMKFPNILSTRNLARKMPANQPRMESDDTASRDNARPDAESDAEASFDAAAKRKSSEQMPPPGTIGAILVSARRISIEDSHRIVDAQLESGTPFGETAVDLGLATRADVQFALSEQFSMPNASPGCDTVDPEVVAAFHPRHDLVGRLRHLRGQIVLRALERTPPLRSVALVSTERRAGRSYVAANLATVFAQLGARTLLLDADLNHPRQHLLFRLGNRTGLSSILAGRADLKAVRPVHDLPGLAVLPSGPIPPNPDDLIARPVLGRLLRRLEQSFDVIVLDTPAWNEGSGARLIAAAAQAAVQLVQTGRTGAADANALKQEVGHVGSLLLGVVMNRP